MVQARFPLPHPVFERAAVLQRELDQAVLNLFNRPGEDGRPPGVLLPVPMYPLYSATLTEYGMHQVNYYLDEEDNWEIRLSELRRAIRSSRSVCNPRAIVVISPGNPNGRSSTTKRRVYHNNHYGTEEPYVTFKKVLFEMGSPYSEVELASFISASKSYSGECGFRGGCCELVNVDPDVKDLLYKHVSSLLCPNTIGQAMMYLLANPPVLGDPSFQHYMLAQGVEPDHFYAMELLEHAGISCCPGHLFFQRPGTYHV
ncbi:GPT2, partial [Cordylochernes scorpioides]